MKKLLILLITLSSTLSFGQAVSCWVSVNPMDTTICPGDSVFISAQASLSGAGQEFNFNTGTLPPGWSTTGSTQYSTPCGPGPNGSPYFWAATATGVPSVTTAAFDVSCGGNIVFDMVYSVQGGASPCEGPDLAHEGVSLQYSTDFGVTWLDITYYSPGGYQLPANPWPTTSSVATGATPYTVWNTFIEPIPAAAWTQNTMFRWQQEYSSGTCCDNWGLEDISVQAGPCASAVVNWSNGYMDTTSFWAVPTGDTTFVAYVYDTLGNYQCESDTIYINLNIASLTWNLVDTVNTFCPSDTVPVELLNLGNSVLPITYVWSTGSTTNPTNIWGGTSPQDEIWYFVDIEDGCGFQYTDSVLLTVNQTLSIDSTITYPASACLPTGAASAFVSGQTGTPFYNWTGPNSNPGPLSVDATVITNAPSGWYYFTVTDNVCTATDSAFIDFINPPIAQFSASPMVGCAPFNVTFTNSSQNTVNYEWDFGDGNSVTVGNMNPQSNTYNTANVFTVTLIAYDAQNCPDTATVLIVANPCGCTDPIALNYNPIAVDDDGSCQYATPTVVVPNVFTPNGDDDNDYFELETENAINIKLTITNRWGNVMYEGDGPNPVWDGLSQNGTAAEEGTYFYTYEILGLDGETTLSGHGFFQLFRD